MARLAVQAAEKQKLPVSLVDLRSYKLPFCGTAECWGDQEVGRLRGDLKNGTHLIFAIPIYNYSVSAATKNLVELMGKDIFTGRTVGFICAAGGRGSLMAVMAFANALMLDFRCWIAPRFVYAADDDFDGANLVETAALERIDLLVAEIMRGPGLEKTP